MSSNLPQTCVKAHQNVDLPLCADSIETCPVRTSDGNTLFACGMYQLDEKSGDGSVQKRDGQVNVYEVSSFDSDGVGSVSVREVCSATDCPGVLDMKWINSLTLGAALSSGELALYKLDVGDKKTLTPLHTPTRISDADKKGRILLSLSWQQASPTMISCSDSGGSVYTCDMSEMIVLRHWCAHAHECWTCLSHPDRPHIFYSGGDDCKLKAWDTRVPGDTACVWTSASHNAGVCSIVTHPRNDKQLLSGSYDEYIHILDERYLRRGAVVSSVCVGGGVWRMKWDPTPLPTLISTPHTHHLSAACMHNGFHILCLMGDGTLQDVAAFTGHESLAYGIDWLYTPSSKVTGEHSQNYNDTSCNISLLSSCSFYDKKMVVWEWCN